MINVSLEEDRKFRRRREHGFPSTKSVDGNPCSLLQGAQYIRTYGRREEEETFRRRRVEIIFDYPYHRFEGVSEVSGNYHPFTQFVKAI